MSDEKISRLKKLKVLAERGSPGEKENAATLLQKLCDKYQISPDQIESSDEIKLRWFRFKRGGRSEKLLLQCMFKTLGKGKTKYTRGKGHHRVSEIGVECTASEGIEIDLDYSFYSVALEKEFDRLYNMFVQKNDIFPPNVEESTGESKLTRADIQMYEAITKQSRVLQIPRDTTEWIS